MIDLIRREEVLKAIDYRRKTANIDGRIILDEVEDRIRELPSADPKWIPCDTSGMPPEGEAVLMSDGKHIWIDETVAWWGDRSDWIGTAWMPLPKPYCCSYGERKDNIT